jgi:hypothetical protein
MSMPVRRNQHAEALLIHTGGFNLGLLMRQLIGVGTPRALQGRLSAVVATLLVLTRSLCALVTRHRRPRRHVSPPECRSIAKTLGGAAPRARNGFHHCRLAVIAQLT